jgi:hypothetical protein
MKHRPTFLPGLALAGALLLGAAGLQRLGSGFGWGGGLFRNPFALTARPAVAGPVVLQQIQKLQRLETCRYNGQVLVKGETRGTLPVWLAGDRMLFVGYGEVVAGLDLARLREGDVKAEGSSVTVQLPPAEILTTRLDNSRSEPYERQTGFFSRPDLRLETRVRVEAEEQIRRAALESGVLDTARENAREAVRKQLGSLGFRQIQVL